MARTKTKTQPALKVDMWQDGGGSLSTPAMFAGMSRYSAIYASLAEHFPPGVYEFATWEDVPAAARPELERALGIN